MQAFLISILFPFLISSILFCPDLIDLIFDPNLEIAKDDIEEEMREDIDTNYFIIFYFFVFFYFILYCFFLLYFIFYIFGYIYFFIYFYFLFLIFFILFFFILINFIL